MEGKVLSTVGGICKVYSNKAIFSVVARGIFRHNHTSICAGDNVEFDQNELVINKVFDRKNSLIRPRSANVDLMLITMSVTQPELSLELLYKFLTYANLNNTKSAVLFTKLDLINNLDEINKIKSDLEKLDIKVFLLSKDNDNAIEEIKEYLKDKTTIIMGQTGVGKSSAINRIDSSLARKIGEYSKALGRGKHQTKEVILFPFQNGFIGDTPGFSSLELEIYKEDLASYFPGYEKHYLNCYFSNCLHQNEKQCKIKEEINNGNLTKEGYDVYLKLLNSLDYKSQRYKK